MRLLLALLLAYSLQATMTRVARGVKTGTTSPQTLSVTVGTTGSSLVVETLCDTTNTVSGITWTGATFTAADVTIQNTVATEIWSAHNVTAGTQTMTVTWSSACGGQGSFIVEEITQTNGAITTGTTATGTGSTNPAVTSTPATITCTPNSGGDCVWIGSVAVARTNNDAAPSWTIPTGAGQKTGGTASGHRFYVAEGFEVDAGAQTQAMSATMATAATYAAALVNYKEPKAPLPAGSLALLGVGK